MPRTGAAFSLVELLVSVTVIGIAYVIMFGPGSQFTQTRRKAACAANLAQMHMALSLYAAEHNDAFPVQIGATTSAPPLSELVPSYTTDTSIFICPGTGRSALPAAQPFSDRRISYAYYMGLTRAVSGDLPLVSDEQCNIRAKRPGDPLFSANGSGPGDNHRSYGGNVLFVDGHVETDEAVANRELPIPAGAVLLNPGP